MKNKVILIIRDGWGYRESCENNAICAAYTPFNDYLMDNYPNTLLDASGVAVGLPPGYQGNSEVGHITIGSGRVIFQSLPRINKSIELGGFFDNKALLGAIENARKNGTKLHIIGLLQEEGVHAHIDHLFAILDLCNQQNFEDVLIHIITDGRDAPVHASLKHIKNLENELKQLGFGQIATINGRFYAMDRDKRWDRTKAAYNCIVGGVCEAEFTNALEEVRKCHKNAETDEFIKPRKVSGYQGFSENDSVFFFNFRTDRTRQLTQAIVEKDFDGFDRKSPFREGVPAQAGGVVSRDFKKYKNLPYNPKLKEKSRDLRKAGNLSEVIFWNAIKKQQLLGLDFDRQKIIGNYIVDFFCPNLGLVIEIDGESHDFKGEYDQEREKYLKNLGLEILHFSDSDVKNKLPEILESLQDFVKVKLPRQQSCHPFTEGELGDFEDSGLPRQAMPATPSRKGNFYFVAMTQYYKPMNGEVVFGEESYDGLLGEVISKEALNQLRISETEKYAHVTFFFNCQREKPFEKEERELIPSPKVETYDDQPEMSASEIAEKLTQKIDQKDYSLVVTNLVNGDMVGHTGDIEAVKKGLEAVDRATEKIVKKGLEKGYSIVIFADHGNAEDQSPEWRTSHTTNPVPCILVSNDEELRNCELKEGKGLQDIAPTVLDILKIGKPEQMTGESLILDK